MCQGNGNGNGSSNPGSGSNTSGATSSNPDQEQKKTVGGTGGKIARIEGRKRKKGKNRFQVHLIRGVQKNSFKNVIFCWFCPLSSSN